MAIPVYTFDAVIVGAGGAGMRAALQLAKSGQRVAVIIESFSNTFPHSFSTRRNYLCVR